MIPLIPLALPGLASLGKSAFEALQNVTQAKTSTVQDPKGVNFDDLLKKMGGATMAGKPTHKEIHALTHQLMQSPEVQAAMAGGKSPQEIGLQVAPDGTVSVQSQGGGRQDLILSSNTQAIAQQLGQARGTAAL